MPSRAAAVDLRRHDGSGFCRKNVCKPEQLKICEGNTVVACTAGESRTEDRPCGDGTCIEYEAGIHRSAACVPGSAPDPRCSGREAYCDGQVMVFCLEGWARQRIHCGEGERCIEVEDELECR